MMKNRKLFGDRTLAELSGHASFIFLGGAFVFQDILYLRVTALIAGTTMAIFNFWHPYGRINWLPFQWNLFLIFINMMNISIILKQRFDADNMSADELELYESIFEASKMSKLQFYQLINAGTWRNFKVGEKIRVRQPN